MPPREVDVIISFVTVAAVAVAATLMTITRANAVHALLYFIVSLFATALMFFLLGAPFAAALEVIVYAGAIMVLFIFVVMLLNLGPESVAGERRLLSPRAWIGPTVLVLVLCAELIVTLAAGILPAPGAAGAVGPQAVGTTLFGPYVLGVELASMLLLAGLVGAYHLGRRRNDAGGPQR
ncbi:MAG: NADH-quinone oxidoreductase subunit J [bacterium]